VKQCNKQDLNPMREQQSNQINAQIKRTNGSIKFWLVLSESDQAFKNGESMDRTERYKVMRSSYQS